MSYQQYPPAPGYPPGGQPYGPPPGNWKGTAALVLGICSLVVNFAFVPGILAIIWGRSVQSVDSKGKVGFILGVIGTVLSLLILVLVIIAVSHAKTTTG